MGLFDFLFRLKMTSDYHDKTTLSERMRNRSVLGDYSENSLDNSENEENEDSDCEKNNLDSDEGFIDVTSDEDFRSYIQSNENDNDADGNKR